MSTHYPDKIKKSTLSEAQARKAAKLAIIKLYQLFLESPLSPPKLPLADFRTLQAPEPLRAKELGFLVFKNGIVENNTSRPLNVSDFRGFTISDPIAPAVFISGKDSPVAWVFTLVHELAHIWRGDSAISDASSNSSNNEEVLCNKIAAETLAPEVLFRKVWEETEGSTDDKLLSAQSVFTVSMFVVARRALDFGLVNQAVYAEKVAFLSDFKTTITSSGGNFYNNLQIRNSKTLTKAVTDLAAAGKLSFKEAGKLLQTSPANVMLPTKDLLPNNPSFT